MVSIIYLRIFFFILIDTFFRADLKNWMKIFLAHLVFKLHVEAASRHLLSLTENLKSNIQIQKYDSTFVNVDLTEYRIRRQSVVLSNEN